MVIVAACLRFMMTGLTNIVDWKLGICRLVEYIFGRYRIGYDGNC